MAFKFINVGATGEYQTLFNRLIEDPETIDLNSDTPGPLSNVSIPLDAIDDSLTFGNIILAQDIGVSGASANNVSFDAFIKHNVTGAARSTFFDVSIMRSNSATTSGFDGFYIGSVILTGGLHYIEFRINHDQDHSFVVTSDASINITDWHHIACEYASGAQTAKIYINRVLDKTQTIQLPTASSITGTLLGERAINFGGRLDEVRLWLDTGSTTAYGQIGAVTAIGQAPEDLSPPLNEFQPSADTLAAWWRFETVSAFQLFSAISASIVDSTPNSHHGTPSGFEGSDNISSETTIINGLSASGDLKNLLGGNQDYGGLLVLDPQDNTLKLEIGNENLIKDEFNSWATTGSNVTITQENNNIFYGASGIKINTVSADTGASINVSNSALLYQNNTYSLSLRYRTISGSVSARVTFDLGNSSTSITAVSNATTWEPIIVRNTLGGATLTGKVTVIGLNASNNAGSLWQIDGLQVSEGDYSSSFVGASRTRKSGQMIWPILD